MLREFRTICVLPVVERKFVLVKALFEGSFRPMQDLMLASSFVVTRHLQTMLAATQLLSSRQSCSLSGFQRGSTFSYNYTLFCAWSIFCAVYCSAPFPILARFIVLLGGPLFLILLLYQFYLLLSS